MGILLAFAPFFVFVIANHFTSTPVSLIAAAATSAALIVWDILIRRHGAKILELGTFLLFAVLAVLAIGLHQSWPVIGVRLRVDAGLLLIVLFSLAVRRPFTLQYAREQVPKELWSSPAFTRTNYIITAVWAAAFAAMVGADLLMLYRPDIPLRTGIVVTVIALVAAIKFTSWYPEPQRG